MCLASVLPFLASSPRDDRRFRRVRPGENHRDHGRHLLRRPLLSAVVAAGCRFTLAGGSAVRSGRQSASQSGGVRNIHPVRGALNDLPAMCRWGTRHDSRSAPGGPFRVQL